jgi:hypothetical protein
VTLRAAVLPGVVAFAVPAAAGAEVPRWKVWLCHPAVKVNYCNTDLSTTVVWPDGSRSIVHGAVRAAGYAVVAARDAQHDCDPRPTVRPVLSPRQGLHAADVNIALGALINLIRAETKAYTASH